jgi:lactate dehydrogenase-like 2-hydroxyacid dehydrogenase
MNILIPDVIKDNGAIEKEIFGSEYNISAPNVTDSNHISDKEWAECDAILAFDQIIYDSSLIKKLSKCKIIVRVGVGFDNVDLDTAQKNGIVVCNVPDYGTEEVADHTMALLLGLTRGISEYTNRTQKRNWSRSNDLPIRLRGKNLGLIGFGRIGMAVALRAKAFGINVSFYDPHLANGFEKSLGVSRFSSLETLAENSNILSLHAPLTEETNNIIGHKIFSVVNKGTLLINTARGSLIDIDALFSAMKKDVIKAAALDVLPTEPNIDSQKLITAWENKEEWIRNRLIVTPHVAFYSPESYTEMRVSAAKEAMRVLNGEIALNRII